MAQIDKIKVNGTEYELPSGSGGSGGGFVVFIGSIYSANLTQLNFADGTSKIIPNGVINKVWENVVSLTLDWPDDVQLSVLLPLSGGTENTEKTQDGKKYMFGGGMSASQGGYASLGAGLMSKYYLGTYILTQSLYLYTVYCNF